MVYYSSCHRKSIKGTVQRIAIYEKQSLETLQTQKILLPLLYAEVSPLWCDVRAGLDDDGYRRFAIRIVLNTFLFQRISTWLANYRHYSIFTAIGNPFLHLRIFALCFWNLRNLQKYCQKGGALQCRRRCRGMVSAAFRSYSASGSGL